MSKYFSYRICSICFNDHLNSGSFDSSTPFVLKDEVGNWGFSYFLDESVPCDSLNPNSELESSCSVAQ